MPYYYEDNTHQSNLQSQCKPHQNPIRLLFKMENSKLILNARDAEHPKQFLKTTKQQVFHYHIFNLLYSKSNQDSIALIKDQIQENNRYTGLHQN